MDIAKIYLSNVALQNKQLLNYINNKELQDQFNPVVCCQTIETNCVKILQQIEFISNQKVYNLSSCTECQQNKTEVSLLKQQLKTFQQNVNLQNLSATNNDKLILLNKEANTQYSELFDKYTEQSTQLQKALNAVASLENFELNQFSKFKQQCVQQIDALTDNLSTQQFINQDLSEQLKRSQTALSAKNAEILSLKNQLLTKSKQLSQITFQVNNILDTTQSCYQNQKHFDDLQQASKRLLFNAKRTLNVLMVQTENQSQLLNHFKIINELNKQQQIKLDEQQIQIKEAERRLSQFKQTVISLQSDQQINQDEYNQYPEISFIIDFKNEIKQLKETNQQQQTQIEELNSNIQQIESQNSELQQIIVQLQDIEASYNSALDTIEQYKEQTSDLQQQITEQENIIELQNNEINRLNQEVLTIIDSKDKIIQEITGKLQNKLNMEDSLDSQQKEPTQPAQQEYQFTFNEESLSDDKNKQNDKELETKNEKLVEDKELNEEENEEKELQDK
ncbi:Hypothetical_protein [Hexamita inflata]|uniref:Hypothetical_protein n=1 Tax=Hexamita inflata TaxID=28002 RepID=A0AA86NJ42_9EUKA|nr:Hypothetical protein HINF_LOCUS8499 [Hexamita inflata]